MKQVLVLGVVAFGFAVGGATWFTAFVAPPPLPPAADSTAAPDSAPVPLRPAARPATAERSQDTVGRGAGARDSAGRVATAAAGARAPAVPLPPPGHPDREKAVAKIMAAMKPKDAVSILALMTDDEVEGILRQLNAKQIAALLAVMPGERAATMSRRLLQPGIPDPKGPTS